MSEYFDQSFNNRDYKEEWCERERIRQENSIVNWIYIGLDTRFNNMAKIGLTTGLLGTRASSSQNPFYTLLCAFKIKEGVSPDRVAAIEYDLINTLSQEHRRIVHTTTNRYSEWFYVLPETMAMIAERLLSERHCNDMHCYHNSDNNSTNIYSWRNSKILNGTPRPAYRSNDWSPPAIDAACFMPGGCGADCNCWG